jgi:hypothetical protein
MFRNLMIITILFFVISTGQQAHAQSKESVASMITCLHEAPYSKNGDEAVKCVTELGVECLDFDPPGGFGQGALTAENCFLSVAAQIKSKMYSYLDNGWPDKNTTGYQLRKIAIEYAIKRSELSCEFQRAISSIRHEPQSVEREQWDISFQDRTEALCLFNYLAVNYWTVVVHDKMQ